MISRASGILLHISSLPSSDGIGDLGHGARQFVDFLSDSGQQYWQMLPLNPTDGIYGESPYSSPSAFACNPLLISLDLMRNSGWLTDQDLSGRPEFSDDRVDFHQVRSYKSRLFQKAFQSFRKSLPDQQDYAAYCEREGEWLDSYAMFVVLKTVYAGEVWTRWPEKIKRRDPQALETIREERHEQIAYVKFLQFVFDQQWFQLRGYCAQKNIQLIGDIPIYVNDDGVDVWANPSYFKLDRNLTPLCVAGVPPDYFSETGQRWGNPVYDWAVLKKEGYAWWMKRLRRQFELFDVVRIDHFRGFEQYWEIPATEQTAVHGQWTDGPRDAFFQVMAGRFSNHAIIGEDLGIITPGVTALMERFGIPGMKVLQFAFGGDMATHPYIPENYTENCVVYTGTHDNNTTRGWFENDMSDAERQNLSTYLRKECRSQEIVWDLMCVALSSRAALAVIPFQDILNLGQEARMNVPGTASGNWGWRYRSDQIPGHIARKLQDLTQQTRRA